MKKLTAFLSALLAAVILLSSCGAPSETITTDAGENTDAPATEPLTTEEITTEALMTTGTQEPASKLTPRDKSKTYNVLMVGNSFSYYNDMNKANGILYKVAKNAGYALKITAIYKGGYYLNQFLDSKDEYGKQVLAQLEKNKFDIVIIQEQSAWPIKNVKDFYQCCKKFKELCDKNGAELWLYSTWGYKEDNSGLSTYGKSPYDMEMKLRAAYSKVGEKIGAKVAYAGAAFMLAYKEFRSYNVYHTDGKHPSAFGSLCIAYTLFGTIFGVDPLTLSENNGSGAKIGNAMRQCASEIVLNGAPIEKGYELNIK